MDNILVRLIVAIIVAALIIWLVPWRFDWLIAIVAVLLIVGVPYLGTRRSAGRRY